MILSNFYKNTIIEKPRFTFAILLIILLTFGYFAKFFQLDASSDTLLLENDPDLKYLREVNKKYGSKDFLVLTYTHSPGEDLNFKSEDTIKNLKLLKNSLENLEWVDNVITILDVPLLKNNDDPLAERIKNFKTLSSEDVDFEVISTNADLTPPSIQSLELSKQVLDVSNEDQSFTYDVSIFDNLAGFDEEYPGWFSFTWQSPSGEQSIYSSPRIRGEDEFVIDNNLGGDYEIYKSNNILSFESVEVIIPQYSEPGTWTLREIFASDAIGNNLYIQRDDDGNYITGGVDEDGNYIEKPIDLDFKTEFEVINSNPIPGDIAVSYTHLTLPTKRIV